MLLVLSLSNSEILILTTSKVGNSRERERLSSGSINCAFDQL